MLLEETRLSLEAFYFLCACGLEMYSENMPSSLVRCSYFIFACVFFCLYIDFFIFYEIVVHFLVTCPFLEYCFQEFVASLVLHSLDVV